MLLNESLFEDYSEPTDFGYKIKYQLDDKVNEIFTYFQNDMGIESGDIEPMLSLELEEAEENLSDVIKKGLYAQMGYYPDEYDESLKESASSYTIARASEDFINYVRDNFDVSSEYIRLLYNLIPYFAEKHGVRETKDMLKETVADSIGMEDDEVEQEFHINEYDESLNEAKEKPSDEDLYWKFVHFFDDLGYGGDVASQLGGFNDAFDSIKNLIDKLDGYYNESLQEAVNEDDAWSYEEIEKSLKDYTNNWKRESGTARTYYKTEKEHIMNALKKHYDVVEPSDGRGSEGEEMSWVIAYSGPKEEGAKD